MIRLPKRLTPAEMHDLYDMRLGMLRPAYDRLADAQYIKRNPNTGEISWPSTTLEDDLRKAGLI